jgi:RNA polymerase sigma factor (sigma-70 family)
VDYYPGEVGKQSGSNLARNQRRATARVHTIEVWAEGTVMATTRLRLMVEQLRRALPPPGGGLTDGQLLSRFVAIRDEAAFAALVRRHGPMVLGVCRRILGHEQDAEDAFQATFLVLATRAAAVAKRDSVGSFLYGVACRTAWQARAVIARRQARERQVPSMPDPEMMPPETQDWRPLLDQELGRLPEKYRAAIVLCELEGRPRREVARQLGVPEGTLSSRLATARKMLARKLSRLGLAPVGGVAAALSPGVSSAQVPAALVWSTARAAALVAAGQVTAAPASAVVLMRGVLQTMFLTKLKRTVGVAVMAAALGVMGLAYQARVVGGAAEAAPPQDGKPATELEALRKENELLKLNLQVVLEKVRAQEAELHTLRGKARAHIVEKGAGLFLDLDSEGADLVVGVLETDPAQEAEAALKALREARDKEAKKRAADALDRALRRLREQLK